MNVLHDIMWEHGFRFRLDGDKLIAVGNGKGVLTDDHKAWIREHKQELIDALELRSNPHCCWICGRAGVAELLAPHPKLEKLGPKWYCETHIPAGDHAEVRERVAIAKATYDEHEQDPSVKYHVAKELLIRAQVDQDLEEGITNPWGWDTSWLPSQCELELVP